MVGKKKDFAGPLRFDWATPWGLNFNSPRCQPGVLQEAHPLTIIKTGVQ